MGRKYSLDPLADLVTGAAEVDDEDLRERPELRLTDSRLEALDRWSKDPWTFLTGTDPDTNRPLIWTVDERDKKTTIKAFPSHLAYLHYLIDVLQHERYVQIEKARQMFVTSGISLLILWRTLFVENHKTLLSKHKEAEAEVIIKEKIRGPWTRLPEWMRVAHPITDKPAARVEGKKSKATILGLPENAAFADARGQTYQLCAIDEAEFQDALEKLLTAVFPSAGQVWFWSTPNTAGEGADTFRSYLRNDPVTPHPHLVELKKKYAGLQGFAVRRNEEKNITIVRIQYTADPAKRSAEWLREAKRPYGSNRAWRIEMEIDRESSAGKAFYPAFAENPKLYVRRAPGLLDAPILRGWDFGRNPACVWGQWSKKSRRFWVLRELQGRDIDTYQFRDLVKFLSGQLSLETLSVHKRAIEVLNDLSLDSSIPKVPWFTGELSFADFAGHEAVRADPGLVKAGDARVAAEVLALGDIYVLPQYTFQRNRSQVINGRSRIREDGLPGIFLDPACPVLIRGLCGEIRFANGTAQNPSPNEPAKEDTYSHRHEALGYIVTNVVALEHADFFAMGPDGQIPAAELSGDEIEVMDSYLTGGEM